MKRKERDFDNKMDKFVTNTPNTALNTLSFLTDTEDFY